MPYFIIEKLFLMPSFDISEKEKRKLDTFLEILERSNASKIIEKEVARDINVGRKSYIIHIDYLLLLFMAFLNIREV